MGTTDRAATDDINGHRFVSDLLKPGVSCQIVLHDVAVGPGVESQDSLAGDVQLLHYIAGARTRIGVQ